MKQKKMKLTSKDVKIMFETNLQDIQLIAMNSSSADDFKQQLLRGLHLDEDVPLSPDKENLKQLILHDGMTITEASTEQVMKLETITILYNFLTNKENIEDYKKETTSLLYFLKRSNLFYTGYPSFFTKEITF